MERILLSGVVCFVIIFLVGCSDAGKLIYRSNSPTQSEGLVKSLLEEPTAFPYQVFSGCILSDIYLGRHNNLIWIKNGSITSLGDSLRQIIRHAYYYGLIPEEYHLLQIDSLVSAFLKDNTQLETMVYLDVLMTDALITMGHHLRHGRIHGEDFTAVAVENEMDSLVIGTLKEAIQKNNLQGGFQALEPSYQTYRVLKYSLKNKIDSVGLLPDSVRGVVQNQIAALIVDLEQWRWEPEPPPSRRLVVNIPAYSLAIRDQNDSILFESKVVVGAPETPTPVLDSRIKNFLLYPYWNVPRHIAVDEILPNVRKDSTYLDRKGYRVINLRGEILNPDSLDWGAYHLNNFPFMIQQSEGAHNALGIIKFIFKNEDDIYLHDTNAHYYFRKDKRALSHGCVRVERAIDMAEYLLGEDNPYCSQRDLKRYLAEKDQTYIRVDSIDINIRYYTCTPQLDGHVTFHEDVYRRNKRIEEAIYCRLRSEAVII